MSEPYRDAEKAAEVAAHLRETSTGLVITGRIKGGKLELDQATADEIAKRFPDADRAFIAMNSPFDPDSRSVS